MTGAFSSLGHLEHQLMRFLPENSFEALEKSFFVTAVNLNAGKAEVFSSGELHKPVMASCAVPLLFAPVRIGDDLYADGGVLNNLPVEPLLGKRYRIIGSNVVLPSPKRKMDGFRSISMRSFELVSYKGMEENARKCDAMRSEEHTSELQSLMR